MSRSVFAAVVALAVAGPLPAQPVNLAEKVAPGDLGKVALDLDLKGNLFVVQNKERVPIALEAKARHAFTERVMAAADGMPAATARLYSEATATATVAGEKSDRALPADRRLVVVRRNPDGLLCFAPAGALSRDDLDLVTEHFNPQCLAGLLPGKAVNVGDSWTLTDAAVQTACLFDAVIKSQLTGKLTAVKDGVATFTIDGTAEGVENGARVAVAVTATGTFESVSGRITSLTWKQKDTREQGPVSPASQVEATVTLKRSVVAEVPKELADDALAKVPAGDVPAAMIDVRYTDPKNRYTIVHPRDWHVTGQTESHLVMRLLDRGEFAAQATVSAWRKVDAGKHSTAEEFKKAIADAPGWVSSKVLSAGEVPVDGGRWLYRVTAEGKMDDTPVVQSFYLLAGPQGDQVAVTVTTRPEKVKAVGTRDAALVTAIELKKK